MSEPIDFAQVASSLIEHNDRGSRLKVTPCDGGLTVDASELAGELAVTVWNLDYDNGEWHHRPSASRGPLYGMLRSIAACYEFVPDKPEGAVRYGNLFCERCRVMRDVLGDDV